MLDPIREEFLERFAYQENNQMVNDLLADQDRLNSLDQPETVKTMTGIVRNPRRDTTHAERFWGDLLRTLGARSLAR
jgi:hypothetical protein